MLRNMQDGKVSLDFIDGYILSVINDVLTSEGIEASGLGNFYAARIGQRYGGLADYDEAVAKYVLAHCAGQRIVDVGAGMGTLAVALALNGTTTIAVEYYLPRVRVARQLRAKLLGPFPELATRYEIVAGFFPEALHHLNWHGRDVTIVFTNVGAGWDEEMTDKAIDWCRLCGEAILDLRLFGRPREDESERQTLFERLMSVAKSGARVEGLGGDYAHFKFP